DGATLHAVRHAPEVRQPDAVPHQGLLRQSPLGPCAGGDEHGCGVALAPDRPYARLCGKRGRISMSQPVHAPSAVPLVAARTRRGSRGLRSPDGVILLFVAPALLLYGIYILYPVVISIW